MTPELRQLEKDLERNKSILLFLLGIISLFGLFLFTGGYNSIVVIFVCSIGMPFAFFLDKRNKLKAQYNDLISKEQKSNPNLVDGGVSILQREQLDKETTKKSVVVWLIVDVFG